MLVENIVILQIVNELYPQNIVFLIAITLISNLFISIGLFTSAQNKIRN